MKRYKLLSAIFLILSFGMLSCSKYLEKMNRNPNSPEPDKANPNYVLTSAMTGASKLILNLDIGLASGVMQYTQREGSGRVYDNYGWPNSNPWTGYYGVLRDCRFVNQKAVENKDELLEGVSLVLESMVFGLITDLYGDIPYTSSLQGDLDGIEHSFPVFERQQSVYEGILESLDRANTLLSKPKNAYQSDLSSADFYYEGDPAKWRKMANSLALRYYLRLAEKVPQFAKTGIEKIVDHPTEYPLILDAEDDATLSTVGTSGNDSWPGNVIYGAVDSSDYRAVKMCATFVKQLQSLHDPRLGVFASKVKIILRVNSALPGNTDYVTDTIIDGEDRKVRYVSADKLTSLGLTLSDVNQDPNYIGLPVALPLPQGWNLSTELSGGRNPHVSVLNEMYAQPVGPMLKIRLISAAEVNFMIAEAKAVYGWSSAIAADAYDNAIKASFKTWGLENDLADYMTQSDVVFDGTQEQIIQQKWIANWTKATEAWFDFRRTGFPALHGEPNRTVAPVLPIRFYYPKEERDLNGAHVEDAENLLEVTQYSSLGSDGDKNSLWSKMWLLQGTGKPW